MPSILQQAEHPEPAVSGTPIETIATELDNEFSVAGPATSRIDGLRASSYAAVANAASSEYSSNDKILKATADLTAATRRRRRAVNGSLAAMVLSVALSLAFFQRMNYTPGIYTTPQTALTLAYIIFLVPICAIVVTAAAMLRVRSSTLRRSVRRLRAAKSAGAAITLIDLTACDDARVAAPSAKSMVDILGHWTDEDLLALPRDQRAALHQLLRRPAPEPTVDLLEAERDAALADLQIALCRAFARIGQREELVAVRAAISARAAYTMSAELGRELSAAEDALSARLAIQSQPRTLLRASAQPAAGREVLVRAAGAPAANRSDQLLRPGSAGNHVL